MDINLLACLALGGSDLRARTYIVRISASRIVFCVLVATKYGFSFRRVPKTLVGSEGR